MSTTLKRVCACLGMMMFVSILALISALPRPTPDQIKVSEQEKSVRYANKIVREIEYVKDSRTGLCYAIYAGQFGFTMVPEEKIPAKLLKVSNLKE